GGPGLALPDPEGEPAGPADDVLLLLGVRVAGGDLVLPHVHDLFAVLRLVRQRHQGQALLQEISQAEVGDVPGGPGRKGPAVALEEGDRPAVAAIDLGAFHGEGEEPTVATDFCRWEA